MSAELTSGASNLFTTEGVRAPAGNAGRFGGRWRLVGVGLSNVWRYGDLELAAPSGRLLMRGPNGTGKTTALESLWPYLLDLNAARLGAGRARSTTLVQLMREGASGKRRVGYAWLTAAGPTGEAECSFGVRLQFAEGASPVVRVVPFTVPGRPLHELALHGPGRSALSTEDFADAVTASGGEVFEDEDAYVTHLTARLWQAGPGEAPVLAGRLRQVRNPTLLGELTARAAADALRESLPGVPEEVIDATAEALAESEATREAFARDRADASVLSDFAQVWVGHAVEVTGALRRTAADDDDHAKARRTDMRRLVRAEEAVITRQRQAGTRAESLDTELSTTDGRISALESSEEYRAAGTLSRLRDLLTSQQHAAEADGATLLAAAAGVARQVESLIRAAEYLLGDLAETTGSAAGADPSCALDRPLLDWETGPLQPITVGDLHADAGPGVRVTADLDRAAEVAAVWDRTAQQTGSRAATAALVLGEHRAVATAERRAMDGERDAAAAAERAAVAGGRSGSATAASTAVASALLTAVAAWTSTNRDLTGPAGPAGPREMSGQPDRVEVRTGADQPVADVDSAATTAGAGWLAEDIEDARTSEPSAILDLADEWAEQARRRAAELAATASTRAGAAVDESDRLAGQAADLRSKAASLRAGQLIPFPRPAWAGSGDDDVAFGAALEWSEECKVGTRRDLVEGALASTGLLGAALDSSGVDGSRWHVTTGVPEQEGRSLAELISVDAGHPLADVATRVLRRIGLAVTAGELVPTGTGVDGDRVGAAGSDPETGSGSGVASGQDSTSALVIGLDGTFRAGVLVGAAPGTVDPAELRPAQFVGARQRRAAALARAEDLDAQAVGLDTELARLREEGRAWRERARSITTRGVTFPPRGALRKAEASRAEVTAAAWSARLEADGVRTQADALRAEHRRLDDDWTRRARDLDLPTEPPEIDHLREHWTSSAKQVKEAAGKLGGRLLHRLRRVRTDADRVDTDRLTLSALTIRARASHDAAAQSAAQVATLDETAGVGIRQVLDQLGTARARRTELKSAAAANEREQRTSAEEFGRVGAELVGARAALEDAEPRAHRSGRALRDALQLPGVGRAVFGETGAGDTVVREVASDEAAAGDTTPASSTPPGADPAVTVPTDARLAEALLVANTDLLSRVERAVQGRSTSARRTVRERYDQARANLGRSWDLDPGDTVGDLETYVLTHRGSTYDPTGAARRAQVLADAAHDALAAAEEAALRDFVIGRLPAAIGAAWLRLHDWVREVNRKMRSAAASSGVGVQVRTDLADTLSPASRITYELSCRRSEADRTDLERGRLGQALQQLIEAAEGATMTERIASAVDIRQWVDVHYEVSRPGADRAERWGQRTALSGGERRLVVLAPMLAAIAAAYDRFAPTSLRLAALDEVPAEVDERGREGLARYLAELDLDLICTSYLWDGAPGAWDGIDAHDLEAGPDGTVVAFPMLIRGAELLPGDPG